MEERKTAVIEVDKREGKGWQKYNEGEVAPQRSQTGGSLQKYGSGSVHDGFAMLISFTVISEP
jgi:hypothetical protein